MKPVASQRPGPPRRRLLSHDQRTFGPGFTPHQFRLFDPLFQSIQFLQHHIQRLLSSFDSRPGITQHLTFVFRGTERRIDRVAQSPFFPNFGEQTAAHPPTEDTHRRPGLIIVIRPIRDRRVGNPNMRLGRLMIQMITIDTTVTGLQHDFVFASPILIGLFQHRQQLFKRHISRDPQNRTTRTDTTPELLTHHLWCDVFQIRQSPFRRLSPGGRKAAPDQFKHHLLPRLILDPQQRLFDPRHHRLKILFMKLRMLDDITIQPQSGGEILCQTRSPHGKMVQRRGLVCLNPQPVKRRQQFATRHLAGTASNPVGKCVRDSVLSDGIVGTTGRDQKRKCRRLHSGHSFNKDGQPVAERSVMDVVSRHESALKKGTVIALRVSTPGFCEKPSRREQIKYGRSPSQRQRPPR